MCCEPLPCKCTNHLAAARHRCDFLRVCFFWGGGALVTRWRREFQYRTENLNCTGTFTSHSPMASWFLSCISQSSWTLSAQWWMVRITGLVSRAPGGPQLTTGLSSVWASSTGGLDKTEHSRFQPQGGQSELALCLGVCGFLGGLFFTNKSELALSRRRLGWIRIGNQTPEQMTAGQHKLNQSVTGGGGGGFSHDSAGGRSSQFMEEK